MSIRPHSAPPSGVLVQQRPAQPVQGVECNTITLRDVKEWEGKRDKNVIDEAILHQKLFLTCCAAEVVA